jgi:multiple sugar transport system substrate-binding protein
MKWLIGILFAAGLGMLIWRSLPPPEEVGRTTIRYMAWGNPEQLGAEMELIREFEQRHPDIHVRLTLVPGSAYYQKLQVMLASGTAPDVFRCDHYQFPAYAHRGYFTPLTDFIAADKDFRFEDYFDLTIREGMYQGRFYGPNVLFGARVIYYNKTAFQREGLTDPYVLYKRGEWTMDQFLEAARRLTKFDERGTPTHFGVLASSLEAWTFVWAFGGDILTPDGARCIVDTPQAVQGLQYLQDLQHKWHVTPTAAESALNAYTFESGRIAMVFNWAGQAPIYRTIRDFQWDVVPVPRGPAGRISMLKGNQLLMYCRTRHPREAWQFMKFYVSRDGETILYAKLRRGMPTRKDVAFAPEYLRSSQPPFQNDVWVEQFKYGRELPITDRWLFWQREWNKEFELLMLNHVTAQEMARRVAPAINETLTEEPW